MSNFLLTNIILLLIVVGYCLIAVVFDRKFKKESTKRNCAISIIIISAGAFISIITSTFYLEEWSIKYLLPILVYVLATISMIIYTCLLKKIYLKKNNKTDDKQV